MRIAKSLLTFLAVLLTASAVAAALGLYLAATGQNLPLLRAAVTRLGTVVAGQRTEQLDLEVRVRPQARELTGTARLQVRATEGNRRRLYFLLNDGLRVRRVWEEKEDGTRAGLPCYQLWLLTLVDLPRPLAAEETTRIGIEYGGDPLAGGLGPPRGVMQPGEILIPVDEFWYPTDLQSFFLADVRVALPADLTLVHNGREVERERRGDAVEIRWTTPRPVAGLALVAGRYLERSRTAGEKQYRALLAEGIDLDAERILSAAAASDALFTGHYGSADFPQITLFSSRALERAFNDGSGLIGVAPRYFRDGDYGFGLVAHEVAHNWWGGTVAEKWLQPGTGGEWIVEGLAEFSSFLAVREHLGEAALLRRLGRAFYDPTRAGVVAAMSALDNALEPAARPTIYQKGAYVALMLQRQLGEEAFFAALRQFLDRFRYRQAGDADLEAIVASVAQQDVGAFFSSWVRSDAALDLALDPADGGATARNHGLAQAPPILDLWRFPPDGEPERQTIALDASTPLGNAERLVLDPLLAAADMYRSNNVLPRRANPRAVAVSARGELMVVTGEPHPWSPAAVAHLSADGQTLHTWEFDRGVFPEPAWTADGTRILAVEVDERNRTNLLALNATDGSRQPLGRDAAATGTPDGVVVARDDRLLSITDGRAASLLRHPGARLAAPVASPDGTRIAYAALAKGGMDLRVAGADGNADRLLLAWPAADVHWHWAPDGSRLFAVLPGDWDWQLWELPLGDDAPRALVREAAAIGSVAVAPDGERIALAAVATLDYGRERAEVFVISRASGAAQRFNLSGDTAHGVSWLDGETLLVVASDPAVAAVPPRRELRRLDLRDGSLAPFP